MKKYKDNYMFSGLFVMSNLLISITPSLLVLSFIFNDNSMKWYAIFFLITMFIMFFVIFGNIINLFISLFTKHTVFIEDDMLIVKKRKKLTQRIKLTDVKHVIFDHGSMGKVSLDPCSLTLHNHNFKETVIIERPSFLLCCYINKVCKGAKFKFNNYKFYIFLSLFFMVMMLFICFLV